MLFLTFSLLSLRLFHLQVLQHSYFREKALRNFIRPLRIQAPRGRILDRNGRILADWVPAFRLHFLSDSFSEKAIPILASLLGEKKVRDFAQKNREGIILPLDVDLEEAAKVEERIDLLPGVVITGIPQRVYPKGKVLSHLLGFTGEVTLEELRKNHEYEPGDIKGKTGLEKVLDKELRGEPGVRFLAVDASGKLVSMDPRPPIPPEAGKDVILTIDVELQDFIDSLLDPLGRGAVVVLDAKTGEILALSSVPTFDPNMLSWGVPLETWKELASDRNEPFLNRAIAGLYPPGSLLKPLIGLIALSLNKVTIWTRLGPCKGAFRYGNRIWRCWHPAGHGRLDLVGAIEQSCDVYFYQLGLSIGFEELLREISKHFRIAKVALGLPGERHSFVPSVGWYKARYGERGFGPGVILNLSIGQGEILVTPLEAAYLTLLIARDSVPPPWVVRRIGASQVDPPAPRSLNCRGEVLEAIRKGMLRAVMSVKGTGRSARVEGTDVAGKTGTAQNVHGKDHSWFTCYAPFKDPEIVVTVIVENAGHGSEVAAPLAGEILRWYFSQKEEDHAH